MSDLTDFSISRIPTLDIGTGSMKKITKWILLNNSKKVLLITGNKSIENEYKLDQITQLIKKANASFERIICQKEPSVFFADEIIQKYHIKNFDSVIAIGGGSVIDLGKVLSALLPQGNSVMDHIEIVGKGIPYNGLKLPFLVLPTTSGTGGEATKNAVLGKFEKKTGFKFSIRHEKLIPDSVIIDGNLLTSLPKEITISSGFDTLTQLIESFLSRSSNEFSDSIVWSGLKLFIPNFINACGKDSSNPAVRELIGYASFCSGVGLTNADLGIVHGIANHAGSRFSIPHGIVCSMLLSASQKINLKAIKQRDPNNYSLKKMALIGNLFTPNEDMSEEDYIKVFIEKIDEWTNTLKVPFLSKYGVKDEDINDLILGSSNRKNPIKLYEDEIRNLLNLRL